MQAHACVLSGKGSLQTRRVRESSGGEAEEAEEEEEWDERKGEIYTYLKDTHGKF